MSTPTTVLVQQQAPITVLSVPQVTAVQAGTPGMQGAQGTDAHYTHTQTSAASEWTITHNLGKYPAITIVDSAGDEVEGNVNHVSVNTATITFSAAFSGRAFLN